MSAIEGPGRAPRDPGADHRRGLRVRAWGTTRQPPAAAPGDECGPRVGSGIATCRAEVSFPVGERNVLRFLTPEADGWRERTLLHQTQARRGREWALDRPSGESKRSRAQARRRWTRRAI